MIHINVVGLSRLTGQRLRRLEAIQRLGISRPTFDRLTQNGNIKVERDATELTAGKPALYVHLAELARFLGIRDEDTLRSRLGLPLSEFAEPEPTITAPVQTAPEAPETFTRPPDAVELKQQEDFRFSQDYSSREATDSLGNRVDGTNDHRNGTVSLIGPREPQPKQTPSGTSHMDERLVAIPTAQNPIDSDGYQELIHPGHGERMAAMYRNAGIRRPSEQQSKQVVDRAAIAAAFRQGFSR